MKDGLPNGTRAVLWAMLPAVMVGVWAVGAAAADGAAESSSAARAIRRVHVQRVWARPGTVSNEQQGMAVCSRLEAVGLRWNPPRIEVRLRTLDGKRIRAAEDAAEGYADAKGFFSMRAQLPALDDRFEWPELCASFPHETALDLPGDKVRRVIAAVRATMGGLTSVAEVETPLPPLPDGGKQKTIRLLAVDPLPNSTLDKRENDAAAVGANAGPEVPAASGPGLKVWAYVEAMGLDGSSMVSRLTIRRPDGEVSKEKDPASADAKPFESRVEQKVLPDQAQFFLHFVPYGEIGLQPGRHQLILSYSATCDGLTASLEELVAVPVAASPVQGAREQP